MRRCTQLPARLLTTSAQYPINSHTLAASCHPLQVSLTASTLALPTSSLPTAASHSSRALHNVPFTTSHRRWSASLTRSSASSSFSHAPLSTFASLTPLTTAFTALSSSTSSSLSAVSVLSRSFVTSRPLFGFEEFFTNQQPGRTGRMWRCSRPPPQVRSTTCRSCGTCC